MKEKITFIGAGNMAKAMIGGIVTSGLAVPEQIIASNPSAPKLEALQRDFGIQIIQKDNATAASQADIIILSVKPYLYETVIAEIRDVIKANAIIIIIAAGQTITANETRFGKSVKLARVMPNTPAMVGEAMSAVCFNNAMTKADQDIVMQILNSFGKAEIVPESMMDAVVGVSGSSPAYVYMFIEAMADAAVLHGMPRAQAYTFAAQSVLGAAKMVLETGMHPGVLKDNVCSPGGTTIEAVASLEKSSMRASVIAAIDACVKKSQEMSK
ncbi:MAG: pyrroline-5-carboxylate reductase [Eubacteriales bacterium]|nr:pyrroline-5-carboxylate reductase [Eubacteriales bacterium]